jgi:hypothetical protein
VVRRPGTRRPNVRDRPPDRDDGLSPASGSLGDRLTYGTDAQWLRNVVAAGGGRLLSRGRWVDVVEPRQFRDASRSSVPLIIRPFLAILRVSDFVEMREKR